MNKVKLITDSVADVTKEMARELDCEVVPLSINIDGASYLDGVEMTVEELFHRIQTGSTFPTSSQVTPVVFYKVFKKYIDEGYKIISVHLSGKLSGTYQSACLAAAEFAKGEVEVVDSLNVTGGQLLLVQQAAALIKEGKSNQEIKGILDETKTRIKSCVMVDTLEFLTKGGRIGKAAGFVGGVLGIKPILEVRDGELLPIAKERGSKKALKYIMNRLENEEIDPDHKVILVNSSSPEAVEQLRPILNGRNIPYDMIHIGGVVGVHVGPNAAAYFIVEKKKTKGDEKI